MAELTEEEIIAHAKDTAKSNCRMCNGRRILRPVDKEREAARQAVGNLQNLFNARFNMLRREDAEAREIRGALKNKRICMDALEECDSCDKEVDRINRAMGRLL